MLVDEGAIKAGTQRWTVIPDNWSPRTSRRR